MKVETKPTRGKKQRKIINNKSKKVMNDLSVAVSEISTINNKTIPRTAICIVITVLTISLLYSIFILVVIHNPLLFLIFLTLTFFILAFIIFNSLSTARTAAFLRSLPNSDLHLARDGQLVKITGPVSCGNVTLESSYEKVGRCVYTSTVLYESRAFELKVFNARAPCFLWRLAYMERFSTEFYISDRNSGIRTLVKAGYGCKVIPLIVESRLVSTRRNRILSPNLTRWLTERKLSAESRLMRLEEGYIQEGNCISVIGMLRRGSDDITMVVQPPELISTGCLWQRLLLPVDLDGLILGIADAIDSCDRGRMQHAPHP